jgi:virginiamycin B lyase
MRWFGRGAKGRTWWGILGALMLVLALSAPAKGAVYWVGGPELGMANQDGSLPFFFWGRTSLWEVYRGCGVAVDGQHMYWADVNRDVVGRAGIRGSNAEATFIAGADEPCGVAVDGSYIYWANRGAGTIGRARIDGTEMDQDFVSGLGQPCGVAVDASHLYWTDLKNVNRIGRADLDGTNVIPDFIEYGACGVAVDSEHIFWSTLASSIGKANLDGSMANDEFIAGLERPCGVALEGGRIYWAEEGGGGTGSVGVANQDGTAVTRSLITDLRPPCGVAVDSTVLVSGVSRPPASFVFGRVRHNYKKGFAFIPVHFPAAGRAEVIVGKGLNVRFLPKRASSVDLAAAGSRWLKISVDPKTRFGRNALRQLKHRGKSKIGFGLYYAEEGRYPAWQVKAVTLRRRLPHR